MRYQQPRVILDTITVYLSSIFLFIVFSKVTPSMILRKEFKIKNKSMLHQRIFSFVAHPLYSLQFDSSRGGKIINPVLVENLHHRALEQQEATLLPGNPLKVTHGSFPRGRQCAIKVQATRERESTFGRVKRFVRACISLNAVNERRAQLARWRSFGSFPLFHRPPGWIPR